MDDFFKYLAPGEEDREWGIYLNVAGKMETLPGVTSYPNPDHPTGYYFTWEKGRILDEFQLNYVTRGEGIYQTGKSIHDVRPGTLMITRPGIWHRYRPSAGAGWLENYVGFDGHIPRKLFEVNRFLSDKPLIYTGNREELIDTYHRIFEIVQEEKPGFQQIASAMVMELLAQVVSIGKLRNFTGKRVERIIRDACFEMRENLGKELDIKTFAEEHHIGYSYFRKMFRQYTGLPPARYQLELKIRRAREMLIATDLSIKEISFDLGFHSIHYFSRIFKRKTGYSPSQIRKRR